MAHNPEFYLLLDKIAKMHDSKNADYANSDDPFANFRMCENMGLDAWKGCLVRMGDKFQRISEFARKGTVENEKIEDTFLDLAIYSLIGLLLYQEKHIKTDSNDLGREELYGTSHIRIDKNTGFVRELTVTESKPITADGGVSEEKCGPSRGSKEEDTSEKADLFEDCNSTFVSRPEDSGEDMGGGS